MHLFLRLALALASLALFASPAPSHSAHQSGAALTRQDRRQGAVAATLAARSPTRAVKWLRMQRGVSEVALGPDRKTIEVHFRGGAVLAILPNLRTERRSQWFVAMLGSMRLRGASNQPSPGAATQKAAVLEPFADELGLGPDAGRPEIDALTQAGFHVAVLRNNAVTVGTMQSLSQYSVVYMETHSNVLPGGDAVVVTGEADAKPYSALYQDHSLLQAFVAGDPKLTLYNAITSVFIDNHMSIFPNSSMVFLNGCAILNAPLFWDALQGRNVAALVSWDNEVMSSIDGIAGAYFMQHLAAGATVQQATDAVHAALPGASISSEAVAHLGYLGDGNDTIANALHGATATPTPTATPLPTPTATPKPKKAKAHACRKGYHRIHGKCRRKKH